LSETFQYNHPGSLVALRNTNGTVAESYSYDPWGRRGDMNGRVYDPVTAGFLSPDPFVTNPYFSQSYNSYYYCVNNPLKFTDPSGYVPEGFSDPCRVPRNTRINPNHPLWDLIHFWDDIRRAVRRAGGDGPNEDYDNYQRPDTYSSSDDGYYYPDSDPLMYSGGGSGAISTSGPALQGYNGIQRPVPAASPTRGNVFGSSGYARLGLMIFGNSLGLPIPHLPDAVSVSGGVKIIAGMGGSEVEGGYIWLLNGPNRGIGSSMVDLGLFVGGIPAASAGITITEYYYMGMDYSNFGFDNIRDGRFIVYTSVGEFLNLGSGASIMGNRGSGFVVGISITLSVGVSALPITIDANWGKTYIK
jgi:RHS repeat-associated protein